MKSNFRAWAVCLGLVSLASSFVTAQSGQQPSDPYAEANAEQVAKIMGLSDLVHDAKALRAQTPCGVRPTIEEIAMRQEITETVVVNSLEVDGVLAELNNEQARLSELSSALQARRDHGLNLLNIANLVTGTGVGIGVNALQFSSATANIGNGLGVGSGIGSTVLSIMGIRRQRGPLAPVGRVPNMLAPLFNRRPELNTYYSPNVMAYLHSVPTGRTQTSRLDQLMAEWAQVGRVEQTGSPKAEKKLAKLTSSSEDKVKVSIDEITDRSAMLADVAGSVSLMKRDLAALMMSLRSVTNCEEKH
jgi:hypothetical protein